MGLRAVVLVACSLVVCSSAVAPAGPSSGVSSCGSFSDAAACFRPECAWCVLADGSSAGGRCQALAVAHPECAVFDASGCSQHSTSTSCYEWESKMKLGCGWCGTSPSAGRCQPSGQVCRSAWDAFNCLALSTEEQCAADERRLCSWCGSDQGGVCQPGVKACLTRTAPHAAAAAAPAAATPAVTQSPLKATPTPTPAASIPSSANAPDSSHTDADAADEDDNDDADGDSDSAASPLVAEARSSLPVAAAASRSALGWSGCAAAVLALLVAARLTWLALRARGCVATLAGYERVPDYNARDATAILEAMRLQEQADAEFDADCGGSVRHAQLT